MRCLDFVNDVEWILVVCCECGVCGDACDFIFWFGTVGFGVWIVGCCLVLLGCVC